jgi:hypothetical protein
LELEIADLKMTLEDEADGMACAFMLVPLVWLLPTRASPHKRVFAELYKSAQRRRHEAEAAHKVAVRRQQETLEAMYVMRWMACRR